MTSRTVLLSILTATAAAVACQPQSTEIVTEIGAFCGRGPVGTLEIEVWFATCMSSSCDTLESSECTLSESNGIVNIEATAEITSKGRHCSADCRSVTAHCSLERPPGTYVLEHAGRRIELTLPTIEEVCSGQADH